ncbi:putative LPS assembly protein LptD [Pelagicoccus sp. SDUM812003]|uniref:putative LPS assembly protein LptD n=1 Tax=Pelagicoccus sp. SDUM812003 TaxID=3041267 RepID=UPI00280D4AE4|nr:putative LPS assembly protein LptD [Pelagicoccus sp. SDUM812003]MDQ8205138.1 putative LPS assembly protein LptD [Pelagicoccus sp. SDUM812003]
MSAPTRILKSFAALILLCLASASFAQEMELNPNGPVSLDERTGEIVAPDGGQIIFGDWLLQADSIRFNQQTGEANAEGNVVFSREDLRLIADSLIYKPEQQYARVENFRAGNGRAYVDGSLLEGNPDEFRFHDINFYPGEPGTFLFEARAGEVALIDQNEVQGKRLFFKVGPVPFLLIPNITQPLDAETNLFKPKLDYSGHIGASIGAEALAPVTRNLRLGGNVALTSKRGVLFGPAARYTAESESHQLSGSFISGYIDDQGDAGDDLNGMPIDSERYFAEWRHKEFWQDNRFSLSAAARYWSDSEVTRDFYEDSFDIMQDPDSYLEANYNGANWQLSLFTRAALGDFQSYTERLPELRFTVFPTSLGHGITAEGFLSAAKLGSETAFGDELSGAKLDGYSGMEWNHVLRDGVVFRLKGGARAIRYEDAEASYVRYNINTNEPIYDSFEVSGMKAYGDFGADLSMKAYRVFDFKNRTWNIDGIRHIIEPSISYRYTPELWRDDALDREPFPAFYPAIYGPIYGRSILRADRGAFASYLPSIDIENRRDTDLLAEDHKVRLAVKNRIQTRHRDGGSRDLARFDVSTDFYLKGSDFAQEQYSLLNLDFELTPAPWVSVGVFSRLDPEDGFSNQELNTRIEFRDEGYWRIVFGSHFLEGVSAEQAAPGSFINGHHYDPGTYWFGWPNYGNSYPTYTNERMEQYFTHLEYQFSENFKLYATTRYDDQSGVFYEQRIGLMQRALERYGLKYEIRFYDGDRREDDFGISLGIDLFDE